MYLLKTPLVPIIIRSIYRDAPLPARMALCTPDTRTAILGVVQDLKSLGHDLRLSDLFRSYEMQTKANLDFVQHRKKAFSPPAGSSMHEAGRAMDIDLSSIGVPLPKFWDIAKARGFQPIIPKPIAGISESWHFDLPGSHRAVYDYVKSGKSQSPAKPYTQMARSGILAIGVQVDRLRDPRIGHWQSALIRVGYDAGPIDGVLGAKTKAALRAADCDPLQPETRLNDLLKTRFPTEYES